MSPSPCRDPPQLPPWGSSPPTLALCPSSPSPATAPALAPAVVERLLEPIAAPPAQRARARARLGQPFPARRANAPPAALLTQSCVFFLQTPPLRHTRTYVNSPRKCRGAPDIGSSSVKPHIERADGRAAATATKRHTPNSATPSQTPAQCGPPGKRGPRATWARASPRERAAARSASCGQ